MEAEFGVIVAKCQGMPASNRFFPSAVRRSNALVTL